MTGARPVVGYLRTAPRELPQDRPSLDQQRASIVSAAEERGWGLVAVEQDQRSGRTLRRPGLQRALDACRDGSADAIVVARLDRLTYSPADLAQLMSGAAREGRHIVALKEGLDTAEPEAAQALRILTEAASWIPSALERAARPLANRPRGRPSSTPIEVAERIRSMRREGATLQAICDVLNDEGVPTPRGGQRWRPTSLRSILRTDGGSPGVRQA